MIIEVEKTEQFKEDLNGDRLFPCDKITEDPRHCSFGKINVIILKKGKTGTKRAVNM